jgi:hypothetical protein
MLRARGVEVLDYALDNAEIKSKNLITIGLRSVWNSSALAIYLSRGEGDGCPYCSVRSKLPAGLSLSQSVPGWAYLYYMCGK